MLAAAGLSGDLFGDAPVPDRHALRPVHRPRPRCAQLRLLPGRALPARRDPERHHARPGRRRAPVDQPAADRARPARPAPLRAGLRRRACGDDGRSLPPDRRPGGREHLPAPLDAQRSARSSAPTTAGARARSRVAIGSGSPAPGAEAAIVAMGAVMPEAIAAWEELSGDIPGLGLLAVTSPDLLHRGWTAAQAARWSGRREPSHVEQLLSRARAFGRPRHHRRRRAGVAVVARRGARPARRPARR